MSKRPLSFWGWGYADRFPDDATRQSTAEQLQILLGFPPLELRDPPGIADIRVPPPRCEPPAEFASFASTNPVNRAAHAYGKSYRDILRGLEGDFSKAPDFVVYPRNEAEVSAVLRWCNDAEVAVVPFGGGTGMVGGVECSGKNHEGVACVDMRAMNRVLEIDTASLAARVEAGATGPALAEALHAKGLTLRHAPDHGEFSTLGGWLATRGVGHHSTLGRRIDELVESVHLIAPAADWATRRVPSSGAGPDPRSLILGSEGSLGIITEAWLKLAPRPRYRASAGFGFEDFGAALRVAREVAQSGLAPARLQLVDKREATMHQLVAEGSHLLLVGFESVTHPQQFALDSVISLASAQGGVLNDGPYLRDQGEREPESSLASRWRRAMIDAPYLYGTFASIGVIVDTIETATTWDRFSDLHGEVVRALRAAVQKACGTKGLVTCRINTFFPDGPAPVYTFVAPARFGVEIDQWAEIRWAAADAVLRAGGTVTHDQGIGRMHRPWFEQESPPGWTSVLQATKRALDPKGILNPGCLIDPLLD